MPQRPLEVRDTVVAAPRLTIRPAQKADIEALVALINAAYRRSERGLFAVNRTSVSDLTAALDNGTTRVMVAMEGASIVGSIQVDLGERAHFGVLATDVERQGRGIGRALIAAAEEAARGASHARMHMEAIREVGLQGFYEALGYGLDAVEEEALDSERSRAWGATRPWAMLHMSKELR
jgi:predicted N-acetyltransferase YhbS